MKRHFNYPLFFLVLFLASFSLFFLACLTAPISMHYFNNTTYFLFHQLLVGFLPAIILGTAAYLTPLNFIKKWAPALVVANFLFMFLVFVPGIGFGAFGATRWINLGFGSIQPSEFLKVTSILYLSAWIASKLSEANASDWKSKTKQSYHNIIYIFLPFLVFLGFIAFTLFLQSDVSTLGIISLTLLALYFSARTPLWHTLTIVFSGLTLLLLLIKFEPYRLDRWLVFLHPDADPLGKGFQLRQALIALGSGGFFGKGLGMSTQKYPGYLPQSMSDSVFAIIGEEFGFLGTILVIASFIIFFWMGLKIAQKSGDKFGKMTAVGIVTWITLQAFINIASSVGMFPLAGIPLPFFSYGGSHLATELIGIGLLLNISRNT